MTASLISDAPGWRVDTAKMLFFQLHLVQEPSGTKALGSRYPLPLPLHPLGSELPYSNGTCMHEPLFPIRSSPICSCKWALPVTLNFIPVLIPGSQNRPAFILFSGPPLHIYLSPSGQF